MTFKKTMTNSSIFSNVQMSNRNIYLNVLTHMCSHAAFLLDEGTSSQTTTTTSDMMVAAVPAKKMTAPPAKKMVPRRKLQIG